MMFIDTAETIAAAPNQELSLRLREYVGWDILRLKLGKADVELTLPKGELNKLEMF
jgi:hypothetical protein